MPLSQRLLNGTNSSAISKKPRSRASALSEAARIAEERANMNLQLGFLDSLPEPAQDRIVAKRTGLDGAIARFEEWMANPDSPVRAIRRQPSRPGVFVDFPGNLAVELRQALVARGVRQLYSHQAESFRHSSEGRNVVVVTPTASGKTLCYNLPVLNELRKDPGARAMYLFPTKALAEDQLQSFQSSVDAMGADFRAFTYDGDTPQDARRAIRERANVVLTNPDMLHSGILPHHTKWAKAFENLRYVVIDELHSYRGVYGSHLANILRRLKRVCEFMDRRRSSSAARQRSQIRKNSRRR